MQRQHPRATTWFYLNHRIDGTPFLARASDLSLGGVAINGLNCPAIQPGQKHSVEFELPNACELIYSDVEVVWRDGNGRLGLRFSSLAPRLLTTIRQYLRSRALGDGNTLMEADPTCKANEWLNSNQIEVDV